MLTVIIVVTGFWLLLAPALLSFSTAAVWTSLVAGVLAIVLRVVRGGGERRGHLISALGVYLVIAGFVFGGGAAWSCIVAGGVLAFAGTRVVNEARHGLMPSTHAA